MLVLSFRDLASRKSGAVTPAAVVELSGVAPGFDWMNPAGLRERLTGGGATYLSWERVSEVLAGKHVLFVTHGFNVDRDHGYAGLGAFAQELLGIGPPLPKLAAVRGAVAGADLVIPVIWPGDWHLPGVNYPFEMGDVYASSQRFAEFLTSGAASLTKASFLSHSLGARVVLETIRRTLARAGSSGRRPVFDTALMAAAAADDDVLDEARYAAAVGALSRIIVVSSWKDSVLGDLFPLGDKVEAALWREERASKQALGKFGPKRLKPGSAAARKIEWFDIDATFDAGHDGYLPSPWGKDKPNGFNALRGRFARFARAAFTPGPFEPDWPTDKAFPD